MTRRRALRGGRLGRPARSGDSFTTSSPAAARRAHDPPNATRSLPFRPETRSRVGSRSRVGLGGWHAAQGRLQGLRLQLLRRLRLAWLRLQLQLELQARGGRLTGDGGAEPWRGVEATAEGERARTVRRAIRIAGD